jgi:hypothetical protein
LSPPQEEAGVGGEKWLDIQQQFADYVAVVARNWDLREAGVFLLNALSISAIDPRGSSIREGSAGCRIEACN